MILASTVSKGSVRARTGMQSPLSPACRGWGREQEWAEPDTKPLHSSQSPLPWCWGWGGRGEGRASKSMNLAFLRRTGTVNQPQQIKCSRPQNVQAGGLLPPIFWPRPAPTTHCTGAHTKADWVLQGKMQNQELGKRYTKRFMSFFIPKYSVGKYPKPTKVWVLLLQEF